MQEEPSTQPALEELETRRFEALTHQDFDTLSALCHRGLRYTHSSGFTDTRDSYLERCRSGFYIYDSIDWILDDRIVIGNTAVFCESMIAEVRVDGVPRTLRTKALAVWARVEKEWLFVAYQATPTSECATSGALLSADGHTAHEAFPSLPGQPPEGSLST